MLEQHFTIVDSTYLVLVESKILSKVVEHLIVVPLSSRIRIDLGSVGSGGAIFSPVFEGWKGAYKGGDGSFKVIISLSCVAFVPWHSFHAPFGCSSSSDGPDIGSAHNDAICRNILIDVLHNVYSQVKTSVVSIINVDATITASSTVMESWKTW